MADGARQDRRFFGHPAGLGVLAGTELWERFSFYGLQSLLMLYMTRQLLLPGHTDQVAGLPAYRSVLSAAFGPMTDLAFAAQTFGLYSGLTYVTPLIGAWIADRLLGKTRTVTVGALFMAAGHLTIASERLFLLALSLLIVGTGLLTGNMEAQVGQLYGVDDDRRTRAFGVYLMALNVGSLAAPLICGTLGEKVAWHWGFGAAGIGILVGLATYLLGRGHLPLEPARVLFSARVAGAFLRAARRVRLLVAQRRDRRSGVVGHRGVWTPHDSAARTRTRLRHQRNRGGKLIGVAKCLGTVAPADMNKRPLSGGETEPLSDRFWVDTTR